MALFHGNNILSEYWVPYLGGDKFEFIFFSSSTDYEQVWRHGSEKGCVFYPSDLLLPSTPIPAPYHTLPPLSFSPHSLLPSLHITHSLASITTSLGVGGVKKRKRQIFPQIISCCWRLSCLTCFPCKRYQVLVFLKITCMYVFLQKISGPKDHSLMMWETLWLRCSCCFSSPPASAGSADGQYLTSFHRIFPWGSMCSHLSIWDSG